MIDDIREKLIVENVGIAKFLASSIDREWYGIEYEDLVSIGYLGLIKAADTYSFESNTKFSTYAYKCALNEICMVLRKLRRTRRDIPYQNFHIRKEYKKDWIDLDILFEQIRKLSDFDRKIVCKSFGIMGFERMRQLDIGKELGVSQSYVSRKLKEILAELKDKLLEESDIYERN